MPMTRTRRHRIALFLSLLMTAFLFCQGMAQAAVAGAAIPARQQAPMSMGCHDSSAKSMVKAQPECPSDCQHLDKASNSSLSLTAVDHVTPMVAFLLPTVVTDVGAIQLASLSPVPPDPDPPATLRFHRFRE